MDETRQSHDDTPANLPSPIRIELLGAFRVVAGPQVIARFYTYKTGALLAYLAYHRHQTATRELLIDLFWQDSAPERGRNNLSFALSSLRSQLEPPGVVAGTILIADRHTVRLNVDAVQTDVTEFERALSRVEREGDQAPIGLLKEAVTLYRGELLPGYYEEWITAERERLTERYVQTLRRLVRHCLKQKELPLALDYARRAVAALPLREELHREVIQIFLGTGQPSAALEQYRNLEKILKDALGETPSAAAQQLLQGIETARSAAAHPDVTRSLLPVVESGEDTAAPAAPLSPPEGMITLLLTYIVGSTAQWEQNPEIFRQALSPYHTLLRELFMQQNGYVITGIADGFLVAFSDAAAAARCAVAIQRALAEQIRPAVLGTLRTRVALMTGVAELEAGNYVGILLHRVSRLLAAAHGGQILCAESTARALKHHTEPDATLLELGTYRLQDIPTTQRLFQVNYAGMSPQEFPPLRTASGSASILPQTFTRFFGRREEVRRLSELLLDNATRLITLSGIGGTGKTRLAQEVARKVAETFEGIVWFVSLADIADAMLIPDTIAAVLRLPPTQSDRLEQVIEALSSERSLLVLDNYEQLVEAGSRYVRILLERLPEMTCLVTSRRMLGLEGEHEFLLLPLPTPPQADTPEALLRSESVQLFVDRAQAAKPDFQITVQNAASIAALCVGLEGIPLALELAAARVQVMAPAQMVLQLQHRFAFLVSRRRDISERQRTLRQALDWSYRLLSPELQRFLTELAVFRGGWTADAAETVCREPLTLDYLADLRECSLCTVEETGDCYRFRLLETVREYALEKLEASGELMAVQERHAHYFQRCFTPTTAQQAAGGVEDAATITLLMADLDNIRAGMDWTMGHGSDSDRLEHGLALTLFLLRRGLYSECEARLNQAEPIARRLGDKAALANFLNRRGLIGWNRSDYAAAEPHFEAARLLCREIDDQSLFLKVLANLGNVSWGRSDFAGARRIWEEALELAVSSGHARQEGTYRTNLAILACYRGEYETAEQYYQDGLALYQRVEFVEGIAFARYNFSELLLYRREYGRALEQAEESLRLFSLLSDRQGIALTTIRIGLLRLETGRNAEASVAFAEGLAQAEEIGIRRCEMYAWECLARLSDSEGDLKAAQERFRRSLSIAGEVGDRRHCAVTLVRLARTLLKRERARDAYRLLLFAHAEYTTLHLAEIDQVENLAESLRAGLDPATAQAIRKAPAQSLEALLAKTCYT